MGDRAQVSAAPRPSTALNRVTRGSAAYAGAAIAQRAVGLVLLPVYASAMGPAEYGQLAVINTIAALLTTILAFGLETALFREYIRLRGSPGEQDRLVNTIGLFLLVVPAVCTGGVLLVLLEPLAAFFQLTTDALALGLVGVAVTVSATILPMVILRAQERLTAYLSVAGATVVTNTILMIVLVVVAGMGIVGWLIASVVSSFVQLVVGLALIRQKWRLEIDPGYLLAALAFGLPLVPHAFSHWALALSDRAILGSFVSQAQIGVYNLAYQLGLPLSVLTIALHQGIMPIYAQASVDESHRRELGPLVTQQVFVTLLLGFGAAILGPPIVLIVMPSSFSGAADVLPWIVLGYTLFGLYLIPMDAVSLVAGKTRWVWTATSLAALVNVGLNLVFVPEYGIMAAAVSTAIAYAVLLACVYLYLIRVQETPIPYEWRKLASGVLAIVLGVGVAILVVPIGSSPHVALLGRVIIGAVLAIILFRIVLREGMTRRPSPPARTQEQVSSR